MVRSHLLKTSLALCLVIFSLGAVSKSISMEPRENDPTKEQKISRNTLLATAEFEPTDAVLLVWDIEYASFVTAVIAALTHTVDLYILVQNLSEEVEAREVLSQSGIDVYLVKFITTRSDTIWIRDYGPISVLLPDGGRGIVNNQYNIERPFDEVVSLFVAEYFNVPIFHSGFKLDGGNFLTNGNGLCLMTSQTAEANPSLDKAALIGRMKTYFGCEQTIFLHKLAREQTGHIDIFAKFISPQTILLGKYDNKEDQVNTLVLDQNAKLLEQVILRDGRTLSVVRIPMGSNKDGIFRSFVNSLYVNGTLIIPTYSSDRDREASVMDIYKSLLPAGTRIVTVDASDIIELEGAVHCITQNFSYGDRDFL